MLLLPVIAVFLWIFVVGLVNDWRADPDESEAGGFSLARLLLPRGRPRTGQDPPGEVDPYPAEREGPVQPSLRATTR